MNGLSRDGIAHSQRLEDSYRYILLNHAYRPVIVCSLAFSPMISNVHLPILCHHENRFMLQLNHAFHFLKTSRLLFVEYENSESVTIVY